MQNIKWSNVITFVTTLFSLFSIITYGTWFISTIEKRVSLLEADMSQSTQQIDEYRRDQQLINAKQDVETHRFEDQVIKRISRTEDRLNSQECDNCSIHKLEISIFDQG
jgi:hypothetical protein